MNRNVANMAIKNEIPDLDPLTLKLKSIVKVFVIDSKDGIWLDCGAGDAQFTIDSSLTTLDNLSMKDLCISVHNNYEEPQSRDYIEPARENKLRNNKEEKNLLLEINLGQSADFNKCQSTFF